MATLKNIAGFLQTNDCANVTLDGWDGKSFHGEGRHLRVWTLKSEPEKEVRKGELQWWEPRLGGLLSYPNWQTPQREWCGNCRVFHRLRPQVVVELLCSGNKIRCV